MRQLKISTQITHRGENSVNLYLQEVNKYPMVSIEEEAELSARIRNGDKKAFQKLVEANLRFVISVAKQYQNQGLSLADLINEGNVGLLMAANKFDETRGFKFISYAVWWIRQSIMQSISKHTRTVRLPLNQLSSINKIKKAITFLEQQYEREPTDSELAEYLNLREDFIMENNRIKSRQVSFDKPITHPGENDITLYDIIETELFPTPDSNLISESTKTDLLRALRKLSKRESEIISLSFGLNSREGLNLQEIAFLLNISSERVRQIKSTSLLKMKRILSGKMIFCNNI